MDQFGKIFHDMLVAVQRLEARTIEQVESLNLSISELHLLESVARFQKAGGVAIRELASALQIKSPSVTVAVQKLVGKGYVTKSTCEKDGRVVRVLLTRAGQGVNTWYKTHQQSLMDHLSADLDDNERQILLSALRKMNGYFTKSAEETTSFV